MAKSNTIELVTSLRDMASAGFRTLSGSIGGMTRAVRASATVVAAQAAALMLAAKKLSDYGAMVLETSRALGINSATLQGIGYWFNQAGGSLDTFRAGLRGLINFYDSAQQGGTAQIQTLQDLDLTLGDLRGKDPASLFMLMADRIQAIPDPMARAALASNVFGRATQDVMRLMGEVPGTVSEAVAAFEEQGRYLSGPQLEALELFGDAWEGMVFEGKKMTADVLVPMLPALQAVLGIIYQMGASVMPLLAPLLVQITTMAAGLIAKLQDPAWQTFLGTIIDLAGEMLTALSPVMDVILANTADLIDPITAIITCFVNLLVPASELATQVLPLLGDVLTFLANTAVKQTIDQMKYLVDILKFSADGWESLIQMTKGYPDQVAQMTSANEDLARMLARAVAQGVIPAEEAAHQLAQALEAQEEATNNSNESQAESFRIFSNWTNGVYAAEAASRAAGIAGANLAAQITTIADNALAANPGLQDLASTVQGIFSAFTGTGPVDLGTDELETDFAGGAEQARQLKVILDEMQASGMAYKDFLATLNDADLAALQDYTTARREGEASMHEENVANRQEELLAAEAKADLELQALTEIRTRRDQIHQKQMSQLQQAQAAIRRNQENFKSFAGDMVGAMIQGKEAVKAWANNFISELIRICATKVFTWILQLFLGGGVTSFLGGLFGGFRTGGDVKGARTGFTLPDTGAFGDRVPVLAEKGEGYFASREEMAMMKYGPRPGGIGSGGFTVINAPAYSFASAADTASLDRLIYASAKRLGLVT